MFLMNIRHIAFLACISVSASAAETMPRGFDEMDYFDRELIVSSKISEIRLTISNSTIKNKDEKDPASCIIFTTVFDMKGNLVRHDLNRVNSYNYYTYHKLGKLTDWGWKDKSSGEITSLAEVYKSGEGDYEQEHAKTETFLKNSLASKIDYRKKMLRGFYDSCYSIDSLYEIYHKDTGTLPRQAIAKRKISFGSRILENIMSPSLLYITYDYRFYE